MLSDEAVEGVTPRRLRAVVDNALTRSPVVAITGPRTAGKSTLARSLVADHGGSINDLDDVETREAALGDPAGFLAGQREPIVIDEFQRAPVLLSAIKASLNADWRPGRFVVTGSARHQAVPELADYLTGRVRLLTLWPFAEAELAGEDVTPFPDRLFAGLDAVATSRAALGRPEAVELVRRGGYPLAVGRPPAERTQWLNDLATLVVERLHDDVRPLRRGDVALTVLKLAAARTAQLSNAADLGRDAGLSRDQAGEYLRMLRLAYIVAELPAWSENLSSRITKRPKLYLTDSGLAAALQGGRADFPVSDPVAAKQFGALFETFVVFEVIRQLSWSATRAEPFHFRGDNGIEVDLVLEADDGRLAAIEVKAGGAPRPADLRGLRHLRDRLGSRLAAGVLVSITPVGQRIDDQLAVVPFERLWSGVPIGS